MIRLIQKIIELLSILSVIFFIIKSTLSMTFFYICTNFSNKMNGQMSQEKSQSDHYFGTEVVTLL